MALVTLVVLASVRVSSGFVRPCRPRGGGLDRWALRGSAASTDALLAFPGKIVSLVSELARYEATREDILRLNAAMDESEGDGGLGGFLRRRRRYGLLVELLRADRASYVDVAGWLHRVEGVDRSQLPNLERVPVADGGDEGLAAAPGAAPGGSSSESESASDEGLVGDCVVANATFVETPVDAFLLAFTRDRYAVHSPGRVFRSSRGGVLGLLDEMRVLMFDGAGDAATQSRVVVQVLKDLMTPVLPPFYRLFMGGLVPSTDRGDPRWLADLAAKQTLRKPGERILGGDRTPFYAPYLTSVVAPLVFGFLVGPGAVNRKADGHLGGLVVQKCKFLQESNCKGLCLHQCKRPAEMLFDELGLPLHVSPNFETQECQWSWGKALDIQDDPDWPSGCLQGCPSRREAALLVYDVDSDAVAA